MELGKLFTSTTRLYFRAARSAVGALRKHPFKPLSGFLFVFALNFLTGYIGVGGGVAGGLLLGLLKTFVLSAFLSLILLISQTKRFDLQELTSTTMAIFGPLMNSLFVLFIGFFLLQPIFLRAETGFLRGAVNIVLFVLANPLPEIVARQGTGGLDAFKEAFEYMKENGPEWLIAVAFTFIPILALGGPALFMSLIAGSDPLHGLFGFISASSLIFTSNKVLAFFSHSPIASFFLIALGVYFVFFIFLFRGYLFEELTRTTRRKRVSALS